MMTGCRAESNFALAGVFLSSYLCHHLRLGSAVADHSLR